MASDVIGVHDAFFDDDPLVEDFRSLIGDRAIRDDWDGRLARRYLPRSTGDVEVFRCGHDHTKMTMLASAEWGSDLAEVAVKAVARFDVMVVRRFANAAGTFLVEKLLGYFVKLHFRRAGEVDVLGGHGFSLGGQGNGCGYGRLLACGGQGDGVVMAACWTWVVTMFLVGWLMPVVFFGGFYPFVHVLMMYAKQLGV